MTDNFLVTLLLAIIVAAVTIGLCFGVAYTIKRIRLQRLLKRKLH